MSQNRVQGLEGKVEWSNYDYSKLKRKEGKEGYSTTSTEVAAISLATGRGLAQQRRLGAWQPEGVVSSVRFIGPVRRISGLGSLLDPIITAPAGCRTTPLPARRDVASTPGSCKTYGGDLRTPGALWAR